MEGFAAAEADACLVMDADLQHPPEEIPELWHRYSRGDVDVALVWGPLAGYFAQRAATPLHLAAVTPHIDPPFLPMVFDISMAVRRADTVLNRRINELLVEKRAEIDAILHEYNVPRVESPVARAAL